MENHPFEEVHSSNEDTSIASEGTLLTRELVRMLVVVAALSYLVDLYNLFLFSIVRVPGLSSIGLSAAQLLEEEVLLLNMQMVGLLIGGIFWGVINSALGIGLFNSLLDMIALRSLDETFDKDLNYLEEA